MPLEDFLMPNEQIRFRSDSDILYSGKPYCVILSDTRFILYSRRGLFFKSDDLVSESIINIQGVTYTETGTLIKKSFLEILSNRKIILEGDRASIKALYQSLLVFFPQKLSSPQTHQMFESTVTIPTTYTTFPTPQTYCSNCGMELSPSMKFCHNCGKPLN